MAGGNLSPRQRMINMMYLVLTALLALNVSKEVLNSFFEVNKGIERTTTNFNLKNSEVYAEFVNAAENNPIKYNEVKESAFTVKNKADALSLKIQEMKYDLVMAVDGEVYLGKPSDVIDPETDKPREEMAIKETLFDQLRNEQKSLPIGYLNVKDNRDKSGSLFLDPNVKKEKQKAYILSSELTKYRDFLIEVADSNQSLIDNINQVCDVSQVTKKGGEKQDWEEYNFYDMPSVGALTILSKIQSDMRNIEADVIAYLKKDIDAKSLKFAAAEGIQIPQSNFVLKGDSFRSQIFITANNPDQNPDIYVGEYDSIGDGQYEMRGVEGVDYEVVKVRGGKGIFSRRASSEGTKKWGGLIKMKTETGTKIYPFKGEYLVASKQAVASPTNMAVLYNNIDNPIKVSVAGYSASQITASIRPGYGSIRVVNKSNGEWIVKPTKLQNKLAPIIDLSVMDDGVRKKMGSVEFKIKKVPAPYPRVAGLTKKIVSRGALKGGDMLIAEMKDFPFDRDALSFAVKSYNVIAYNASGERLNIPTIKARNGEFTKKVRDAIDVTPSGGTITFKDIVARQRGVKNAPDYPLEGALVYTIK